MSNKSHISGLKIFLLIPQSTVIHEQIHSVHTAHDPGPYDGRVAAILSFNLADHLEKRTHRSLEGFCERCVHTHRRRCLGVTEGRLAICTVVLKQSTDQKSKFISLILMRIRFIYSYAVNLEFSRMDIGERDRHAQMILVFDKRCGLKKTVACEDEFTIS